MVIFPVPNIIDRTLVFDEANKIRFIDRQLEQEVEKMSIPNITNSGDYITLLPFP
jgi:hypothetical protein